MVNETLYVFKIVSYIIKDSGVVLKSKGSENLCDFDGIIRKAFNHDTEDHLCAFYNGKVWQSDVWGI